LIGAVSGFLLSAIRKSAGLTQLQLAEDLGVDAASVQSWESGRRPLAVLRTADVVQLRARLLRHNAQPTLLTALGDAIYADLIITDLVQAMGPRRDRDGVHPLGVMVHQCKLSDLITWSFTGRAPAWLQHPAGTRRRRGPAPVQPTLSEDERRYFFDHLLATAHAQPDDPSDHTGLARRQAIYLLGFDTRRHITEWLHAEHHRALRDAQGTDCVASWLAVRSAAVALAHAGDRDPLRAFLRHARATDQQEQANLNYWAYWVGEIDTIQVDDTFMTRCDPQSWTGVRLLQHLLKLLQQRGSGHAELNIHTIWALLVAHPTLLSSHPHLRLLTATTLDHLTDDHNLSPPAQRELSDIAYTLRLAHQ
jgi:hypothetical protein